MAAALRERGENVVIASRLDTDGVDWAWDMTQPMPALPNVDITDVVLNASIFEAGLAWTGMDGDQANKEAALLARHLQINVTSGWRLIMELAKRRPLTSVVMLLDARNDRPWPGYSAYHVSRAAGYGMMRALAHELAPTRVNAIAPGTILPGLAAKHAESLGKAAERSVLGGGKVKDVVDAVLFLRDAGHITGEMLRVDGGLLGA